MEIRRPLKRALPRLGPPDIYPQDPKQKEDELTSINVKQGYTSAPLVSGPASLDEFGSAKNANIDAFGVFFSALLSEKHRIDTLKDTQKKKQLVNTKEIWYVHAKTKHAVDNWFRDLANGTKSLGQLGKRIPIFNSKEGMFSQLYESHVPLTKAVWFIKMSAVHAIALSESSSKSKKRQVPDQYQELTAALIKYLREISIRMFETYQQSQGQGQHPQNQQQQPQIPPTQSHQSQLQQQPLLQQHQQQRQHQPQYTFNQWQYQTQLARYLFDEGLLDQYDFLCFLLELIEKKRQMSELFVKIICPLILEYVIDFSRSAVLSRRLAHVCARKLCQALHHYPMTAKNWASKRAEPVQNSQRLTMSSSNSLNNFDFAIDTANSFSRNNRFDSRISDTQSYSLTRNSSPAANNTHLTANSILDIVKAQIIESQNSFVDKAEPDQENSENILYKNSIYILSSILQVICIECPTAMVRHHIVEPKFSPLFQGSPLDHLPRLPSNLPMLDSDLNFELRKSIHDAEREILQRSAMADSKWSCESSNKAGSSKANLVNRLLTVMDILDKHNFDRIDSSNSIDILYSKIFPSTESISSNKPAQSGQTSTENTINRTSTTLNSFESSVFPTNSTPSVTNEHGKKSKHQQLNNLPNSNNHSPPESDIETSVVKNLFEDYVIKLLCEWATTTQRTGEHRALIVARILEKRQASIQSSVIEAVKANQSKLSKSEDLSQNTKSASGQSGASNSANTEQEQSEQDLDQEEIVQYTFQNLLVQFLDESAPTIEDSPADSLDSKKAFNNLVSLFSELIRCDVFSHYNYMCTLISRGMFNDLSRGILGDSASIDSPAPMSNLNQPGSVKPPRSVGKESDSILPNTILGGGGSNIFPLSVSTSSNKQSNHLDPLSGSMGFSPDSSQPNASQSLYKGPGGFDHHSDDVDVDISMIAARVNERDQDEDNDFKSPDYGVGSSPRDDNGTKTTQLGNQLSLFDERSGGLDNPAGQVSTNVMSTSSFQPSSVESKPLGVTSTVNEKITTNSSSEQRHSIFVKNFPVPYDEYYSRDINQRMILLYGFGKERDEARHPMRKLSKEITKIIRKAARDFNDGGKLTKFAIKEGYNTEAILKKFERLNHYDQHELTNDLSDLILEIFTLELSKLSKDENDSSYSSSKKAPCLLPTLESLSFAFSLFSMATNVSGLLELIVPLLEKLTDVRAKFKDRSERLASEYTHSIALCIISMLYRYHSCVLLLPGNELNSIFKSLSKLVHDTPGVNDCRASAERVIYVYLHDLHSQASQVLDSNYTAKFRQLPQNPSTKPDTINARHDYMPILVNLIAASNTNMPMGIQNASRLPNAPLTINDIATIREKLYEDDCRRISETSSKRYSFVCDAIYYCSTSTSPDFVNELAVLCADITTRCPSLMSDWVQVLQDLCSPAQRDNYIHNQGFSRSIFDKIDISSPQVIDNIAIFTAILVARRCLELSAFIRNALTIIVGVDQNQPEAGIRLTCHLTLIWYRNTEYQSNQPKCGQFPTYNSNSNNPFSMTQNYDGTSNFASGLLGTTTHSNMFHTLNGEFDPANSKAPLHLKYLCDHHLLRSACFNIKTEFHLLLLKAIKYLASFTSPALDPEVQSGVKIENHFGDVNMDTSNGLMRNLDGSSGLVGTNPNFNTKHINLQTASLHQFADAVLRLLCSQRWLHDKCLSDSDLLASRNLLFDPRLDVKQSQGLLYMICYNKSPERQADVGLDDQGSDQVASIVKMFENLDVWSMRLSLVRLQFMYAYCKSQSSVNDWLDNLAKAVVEFFQKTSQDSETPPENDQPNTESNEGLKRQKSSSSITNINKVWLVEPLLEKLDKPTSSIPSKIIKASAALMESASVRANSLPSLNQTYLSTAAASTKFKERTLLQRGSASTNPSNLASTSLLGFQPFLSLLLSCLKNQDKERETLLTSLNSQLYQAIHEKVDDIGYKQSIQDGLELRLCLIGQMFDTIQRSAGLTSDWATLLLLLIMNNLVDPQVDYKLYVSVLDMLAMLIHSAYASDPIEQKEEAKKQYQNLMKKFRKELAALEEKSFIQMKLINPLMPLVRQMTEVITCEPMGSLVDTKGEKVENFFSIDSKKGLKVSELQEVSPWDLIEGHKNPAPLSWPWFGAIRLEHKPLRADENNRLMSWHTHIIRNSTSYFVQGQNSEDGPSSAKRSNAEKKPSQSNPLLKSLIEASDESPSFGKSRDSEANSKMNGDDIVDGDTSENHYIGRDDLLEDYCEMPVGLLFDPTPIETMIDDIKSAMLAEQAAGSSRAKPPPPVAERVQILGSSQASSILAPAQPPSDTMRAATPKVSALSALQNHLNAAGTSEATSLLASSGPPSVPPSMVPMSPLVNPRTPDNIPNRPPSNSIKIAPTPPPMSVGNRSMSPMVGRSPALVPTQTPPPAPKRAPKTKRASRKKDANIDIIPHPIPIHAQPHMPPQQINLIGSHPQAHQHQQLQQPHPQLQQSHPQSHPAPHQMQIGIPGSQHQQHQQTHSQTPQHMQAQHQHHPMQYQQATPNQHHTIQHPGPAYSQQQPMQQTQQMNMISSHPLQQPHPHQQPIQHQQLQQQHPQQTQSHLPQHQLQMAMGAPQHQQHQQQHPQAPQLLQAQHQHHPMQYQQQATANQHHPLHSNASHPQQQQMPTQQIRLAGQHQHQQQQMTFQQIQPHPHAQQQMFAPQQAAGHSRPALTAMLHQKHAAAGNMDNKMHPPQRFNFG